MKLIHCADLHLNSPLNCNLTASKATQRQKELLTTFSRMVDYAVANNVQAVLISGDTFDGIVLPSALDFFRDVTAAANNVQFFVCVGNHDEQGQLASLASRNVTIFGNNWSYHQLDGITIAGLSLCDYNVELPRLTLAADAFNVVMLHGQEYAHATNDDEGINLNLLKNKHIDYLALGHIHSYKQAKLDERGIYCYSGCLEGRGYDETGSKGFVLIEKQGQQFSSTFIPFASRTIYNVQVDISRLTTAKQIEQACLAATKGLSANSMVKITLTGSYEVNTRKDLPLINQLLCDKFFATKIKDESKLCYDHARLAADKSVKGEFARLVAASQLDEATKQMVLYCGLAALSGEKEVF